MGSSARRRRFSDEYHRLLNSSALSLDPAAQSGYKHNAGGAAFSERLLHCIWFDQLFEADRLRTTDGVSVRVLSPGFWNLEAGPDFHGAELVFGDGGPVRGDVEIHIDPAGWRQHGHATDPRYNGVVLHVTLENPRSAAAVRTPRGEPIPQVCLGEALTDELVALRQRIQTEDYPYASTHNVGRCFKDNLTVDADDFWRLVALAGEARFLSKAHRAAQYGADWNQVCYVLLLQALCYKAFAQQGRELALGLPYALLQSAPEDSVAVIEGALLGAAGLLPHHSEVSDQAAAARVAVLAPHWNVLEAQVSGRPFDSTAWKAPNVRPANQPSRRLAGAAHLLSSSLRTGVAQHWYEMVLTASSAKSAWRNAEHYFSNVTDTFWDRRASLTGPEWKKPQAVIGAARARILVVDALIPALLARALAEADEALEHRLHEMVATAPAQSTNARLKLALYRMRGAPDAWPKEFRTALHGQGLLHILGEWCLDRPTCEGCGIHRVLSSERIRA